MAVATFTITEVRRIGATRVESEIGEVFEWTSDREPADGVRGGARATPFRPWVFGQELRTVRTDYPGAKTPSEQVLGPNHIPFTLRGRFDDRYNFPGFAVAEMRRFEAMVRRGNMVRIQFQNQAFECLILKVSFDYHREWYIPYEFSVSTHDRLDDLTLEDRSPQQATGVQEAFDNIDVTVLALEETNRTAPINTLTGDLATTTTDNLAAAMTASEELGNTVNLRTTQVGDLATISPFRRVATQLRTVGDAAGDLVGGLSSIRSDDDLAFSTALSVLDFEDWSRTVRFQGRVLLGTATLAARDVDEREDAQAQALYRPRQGESLYNVSRRFYGTPFAWRLIADRNGLQGVTLTGDELLVIPQRGEA